PMMEKQGQNPAVLLVASLAGLALTGSEAANRLLNAFGAPVPDAFLKDVARELAARGHHAIALKALSKIVQPDGADRPLGFLLQVERRDVKEAQSALKLVSDARLKKPALTAARLWVLAQDEKTKGEATSGIKALVALPRDLERVDLVTL